MFSFHFRNSHCYETNHFIKIIELINPIYPWKYGINQVQVTLEKLLYRCVFYTIAKGPSPRTQQRDQNAVKNTQLDFYYYFSYICVDLIYLTCLILLKSPWWPVWRLCAQDLLKRTLLSSVICVLLNLQLFSRNTSPWLLLWVKKFYQDFSRDHLNSVEFFPWWSITRKCQWWRIFWENFFLFILISS